jgi:alpha-ketoglutarate-dependent taurine dioxygenase
MKINTINYEEVTANKIIEELQDNGVVCLEGANLSIKDYQQLTESLGKPLITENHILDDKRFVQELSETGLFGDGDVEWHCDWSYGRGNYFGTMLYNVEGGELANTVFFDMTEFPNDFYQQYKEDVGDYFPPKKYYEVFTEKQMKLLERIRVKRPFVFPHPTTGDTVLYCSPVTLQKPHPDIDPIIKYADRNSVAHQWKPGQILIWDNLRVMHKRGAFEGHRLMWRSQFIL